MDTIESPVLAVGDIVTIIGDNNFTDTQGIVVDTCSDKMLDDGPIAIYFDNEVPDYKFNRHDFDDNKWTSGIPTKDSYKRCYRVICFKPEELRKEVGFSIETIVNRIFGKTGYNAISVLNFPLKPGTHPCQVESCETGLQATELTLVNIWGTIMTIYTCTDCHRKWHGARTDGVALKEPLPGAK